MYSQAQKQAEEFKLLLETLKEDMASLFILANSMTSHGFIKSRMKGVDSPEKRAVFDKLVVDLLFITDQALPRDLRGRGEGFTEKLVICGEYIKARLDAARLSADKDYAPTKKASTAKLTAKNDIKDIPLTHGRRFLVLASGYQADRQFAGQSLFYEINALIKFRDFLVALDSLANGMELSSLNKVMNEYLLTCQNLSGSYPYDLLCHDRLQLLEDPVACFLGVKFKRYFSTTLVHEESMLERCGCAPDVVIRISGSSRKKAA
jgi:hypothetical protein